MSRFFIALYHILAKVKWTMFSIVIVSTLIMLYASLQIKFEEDYTRFFPKNSASEQTAKLFSQIKIKDKIVILFTSRDSVNLVSQDTILSAANDFERELMAAVGESHIKESRLKVDAGERDKLMNFVYGNLPIFLEAKDFDRFDSLTTEPAIETNLQRSVASLLSPAGYTLSSYYQKDPIGVANSAIESLQKLQLGMEYNLVNNYIFSQDNSTLLYIITPINSSSKTTLNEKLVESIESSEINIEKKYRGVDILFMGGPTVGVYNARQIKSDTFITLTVALLVIILLLYFALRRFSSIILLLIPALFGALFALAIMSLRETGISAIAVGAGATILGIALSYSIHILSHLKHVKTIEQLIDELAYPLTIGSFTTVGAFIGLQFTQSALLQDFGMFASLTLIGTTIFSLVVLPHMLTIKEDHGINRVNEWIEKFSALKFEKSKLLIIIISALFIVGLIFSPKVKFESDMMKLNYEPQNIKSAENCFRSKFKSNESRVLLLSTGETLNKAINTYNKCDTVLNKLKGHNVKIEETSINKLLVSDQEQIIRINRWNKYWTKDKIAQVSNILDTKSVALGFSDNAFNDFKKLINTSFSSFDYSARINEVPKVLLEWIEVSDSSKLLITQLFVRDEDKQAVYEEISKTKEIIIVDRAHFAGVWATAVKDDFYFILSLCSLLVFGTLLVSYGRFELAALAFVPMMVSWVIILGLMAVFNIPFNIVNILLSTFIFGIGDDFSIFVLDGLQNEFSRKKMILSSHKTAIFFSTVTVIIGMGALLFAKHPALQSISLISVLGMVAVWVVAYTVQPILFKAFISNPSERGLQPNTLSGFLLMILTFSIFSAGCALAAVYISISILLPLPSKFKRELFHKIIHKLAFVPVRFSPTVRIFRENEFNEDFKEPSVIIVNHQSFIDILMMLSVSPRIIMMTNHWVWNSPFFGHIVRYAGFLYYKDGIENHLHEVRSKVAQGYSVLIFPEGTRSTDQEIHRFHKGAFFLAQKLSLDILPILIYGNGNLVSKNQPFYVKHGVIGYKILKRIKPNEQGYSSDYSVKSKEVLNYLREEYSLIRQRYDTPKNHFFYNSVIANYIYKGPVLEWYMRIKITMEKNYQFFHEVIPLKATITDIGCGYGPLCFMLGALSSKRTVLGIDYDKDKIEIAQNCYSTNSRISFLHANVIDCELPQSDVFVLNDILHYLPISEQEILLAKCVNKIEKGGIVIVRDGDSENKDNHKITRLSEWFSIKLIGFNKASQAPCFTNKSQFEMWAKSLDCTLDTTKNDKLTSNTIYIFKKRDTYVV